MQHLIVMGVAGSGKTTVAVLLAQRLGWTFAEADDFHPPANVAKMAAGTPLDDDDRAPWLATIAQWVSEADAAGRSTVVTCSALRRAYRDVLASAAGDVRFVHLEGDPELIGARIAQRTGHFMPPTLLPSQLATLEPLQDDEPGVVVPIGAPPEEVVEQALVALGLEGAAGTDGRLASGRGLDDGHAPD